MVEAKAVWGHGLRPPSSWDPQCAMDGWTHVTEGTWRHVDCSAGTGEVWLLVLASALPRLLIVLGYSLLSRLGAQALWVALPKPTTAPLPGTVASCVAFSPFETMGLNISDTAIGGLPGLRIFTFSVAPPRPASVTFPQEFCFLSHFSLPPKIWGRSADSGLKPNACPKAKIPHGCVSRVLWDLKNMKRAAQESWSGWAGGAPPALPRRRHSRPSATALRRGRATAVCRDGGLATFRSN